ASGTSVALSARIRATKPWVWCTSSDRRLHLPARRGGRRRSRRVGARSQSTMLGSRLSPPRSPGRSAAKPPGGGVKSEHDARLEAFTSPLAGEGGGEAAGWGREVRARCSARDFHLPARRGRRRRSPRAAEWGQTPTAGSRV